MEPAVKPRRKRGDPAPTTDHQHVPPGWSPAIRRWLAAQTTPTLVAEHWTSAVLPLRGGPVRMPLEAIRSVTVGNLAQVLDHRVTRSLCQATSRTDPLTTRDLTPSDLVSCLHDLLINPPRQRRPPPRSARVQTSAWS